LRGWEKLSNIQAIEFAQKVAEMGVERVVYTDIARDGMLSGVNIEATRAIAEASGLKITASGGVASLDDVYAVKELEEYGADTLIIGKGLYEGIFTLEEALDAADDYDEEWEIDQAIQRKGTKGQRVKDLNRKHLFLFKSLTL